MFCNPSLSEDLILLKSIMKLMYNRAYSKRHYKENKSKYQEKNRAQHKRYKETGKIKSFNSNQPEYQRKYRQKFRALNPDKVCKQRKKYKPSRESLEKSKKRQKQYYNENKHILNPKAIYKRKNNLIDRLKDGLRGRLYRAIKNNYKSGSAVKDLGCSVEEFKTFLEKLFTQGMNWNNWGKNGWQIDHIIPLSAFDLSQREQFLKAAHYTNLRPLWATTEIAMKYGEDKTYIGNLNKHGKH